MLVSIAHLQETAALKAMKKASATLKKAIMSFEATIQETASEKNMSEARAEATKIISASKTKMRAVDKQVKLVETNSAACNKELCDGVVTAACLASKYVLKPLVTS